MWGIRSKGPSGSPGATGQPDGPGRRHRSAVGCNRQIGPAPATAPMGQVRFPPRPGKEHRQTRSRFDRNRGPRLGCSHSQFPARTPRCRPRQDQTRSQGSRRKRRSVTDTRSLLVRASPCAGGNPTISRVYTCQARLSAAPWPRRAAGGLFLAQGDTLLAGTCGSMGSGPSREMNP